MPAAFSILMLAALAGSMAPAVRAQDRVGRLEISANHRYFQYAGGEPFFWLGDTGWLMFKRLNREETETYLENRRRKGFNVIQAMVLHSAADVNAYGAEALVKGKPGEPRVTPGKDPSREGEYDFWDHVDWVLDRAVEKGIYIAMVAAWGSIARAGQLNESNVEAYARFLAGRYGNRPNVIWLTGGDTHGDRQTSVWRKMGETFKALNPDILVTFHPFGRTQSSTWFHSEPWLDFNMFQSGHRRYDQDDTPGAKGEDNWRYVAEDLALSPPKPTLDGEPSYEGIPQGLHDITQPRWRDHDVRRYAYWAVFAGAAGHTYGHSAVMQMYKPQFSAAYGNRKLWNEAIDDPGAGQMQLLKNLILSRPYFERIGDQSIIAGVNGERYDYVIATRGKSYLMAYAHTGRPFRIRMGVITGRRVKAWWFSPKDGSAREIGTFENRGERQFVPPGNKAPGNDWVLVLDDAAAKFGKPGGARRPARAVEPAAGVLKCES